MAQEKSRLDWVDAAKGISIILVVMMHSAYGVGTETGRRGLPPLRHRLGNAVPHARVLPDLGPVSVAR
jgi:uncharacterized membrane protein YcfT